MGIVNPDSFYRSLKGGIVNQKTIPYFIHFTILLANNSGINSRKKAKNNQGIRIAILLESELTQPLEQTRIRRTD